MDYLSIISVFLSEGVIVTVVSFYLDKKKDANAKLNSIMDDKYRSLLVFVACVIDIDREDILP